MDFLVVVFIGLVIWGQFAAGLSFDEILGLSLVFFFIGLPLLVWLFG